MKNVNKIIVWLGALWGKCFHAKFVPGKCGPWQPVFKEVHVYEVSVTRSSEEERSVLTGFPGKQRYLWAKHNHAQPFIVITYHLLGQSYTSYSTDIMVSARICDIMLLRIPHAGTTFHNALKEEQGFLAFKRMLIIRDP